MDESIAKEIEKLKKDIGLKKERIQDIKKLANKEIDRSFPSDLEELSEKELDSYLEEYLGSLDKSFDPTPDKMSFTSHRKILGKPIILLKRLLLKASGVYINLILDKQKKFNQQSIVFYRALLLRIRRNQSKIKHLEQRISECEANLVIFSKKLEELSYHEASEKDE
jgi:hypothetical protein